MTYSKIVSVVLISLLQLCNLSQQAVTTDGCGTTKGCLREPADCSDTDCTFFATYSYQQDYVVFELFGKDSAWVAIGFNALQQRMVISDALVCYVNNSVVLLKSAKLEAQDTPALKEAKDLNLTYSSTNGNAIQCRFTHPFRPTNTSILRNLDDEFYLVWATSGEFRANVIQKHQERGVSAYRVNLTRNTEVRAPSTGISADDCGKTIGCLRYPAGCEDGDCDYMATYSYQNDRVTFEMFGKESQWVAIGFSDDNLMPNTDAVVCKTDGSPDNISIVIRSANITEKSRPTLEKAGDLHLSGRSYFDNHIQCRFSHPYIPEDGSNLRNLSRKAFMIYAKGLLALSGSDRGKINRHVSAQSSRGASPGLVDFKKVENFGKREISTDGCDKTIRCLRFSSDCSDKSCEFVATYTYQSTTKTVTFELFGKSAEWVAIGFSEDNKMPDTGAVICYNLNGNVVIRSAELVARSLPGLHAENDLNLLDSSLDGGIYCRFTYPLIPGNTSKLRTLDQDFFLLYAKGPVSSGTPNQHSSSLSARGGSPKRVNVVTGSTVTPTTEPVSQKGISTDGCGDTMGCLRFSSDCNGGSCEFVATYTYQPTTNIVTFELFGKSAEWVAIGFSDDNKMPDTGAVICYNLNGNVVIRSAELVARSLPGLHVENDLNLLDTSLDGGIRCRFTYPLTPGNTSTLRRLDQEVFLLYAKGSVSGDTPNQHSGGLSARGSSSEPVKIIPSSAVTPTSDPSTEPSTEPVSQGISTDGCGDTMGCLRFSSDCNGGSCEFVATYTYQPTTNIVTFELFGKSADWVAIGFSDDNKMPDTDAVICYNLNGNVVIRSAKLVARSLPGLDAGNDLNLLDSSLDGGIRCRFTYPLTPGNTSTLRRLDQEVFLLYAKGSVSGSTPSQHSGGLSARGSSSAPVNITSNVESTATSPSKLQKKVHGSLMAVVWILLASSGLFFARYTRDNWPDTKLLGTKVWFQFHRFLMICVVLGTIASIVVIFVDLEGYTEREETIVKVHAIFGLIVLVLAVLQPIGALLRPHPGTPKRPIFNVFHRSFGASAFGLAMITIILGLDFFNKDEAYYTVIVYIIFLGVAFVIMDISKYLHDRRNSASENATMPGGMEMQSNIATKSSFHLTLSQILLGIVSIGSLIVTIVVIVYINRDDDDE